jgi:hypothetical protein
MTRNWHMCLCGVQVQRQNERATVLLQHVEAREPNSLLFIVNAAQARTRKQTTVTKVAFVAGERVHVRAHSDRSLRRFANSRWRDLLFMKFMNWNQCYKHGGFHLKLSRF